jgi:predicted oxidoreductase
VAVGQQVLVDELGTVVRIDADDGEREHGSDVLAGKMMFGPWGKEDRDASIRIMHHALAAGINFVDTTDVYSRGVSEDVIEEASRDDAATLFWPPSSSPLWR